MSLRIPREVALQQEGARGKAEQRNSRFPISLFALSNFWMLIGLVMATIFLSLIIAVFVF